MEEYERDLKIDKDNLDVDWTNQPALYMKWAERHAQALYERDKKKDQLELVRAELDSALRTNPDAFGFDKKPTESAISAWITSQDKYKKANLALIEANKDSLILAGAREAMNHKRSALENMVKLWLGSYYADPNIPSDAKKIVENNSRVAQEKGLKDNPRLKRREKS